MKTQNLENKNVVLVSHAFPISEKFNIRSGPVQPLIDFFAKKTNYLFVVGQPPPYVDGSLSPFLFVYQNGILNQKIYLKKFLFLYDIPPDRRVNRTYLRLKIRDFLSVLYFARIIKQYLHNDSVWLYFGVESVNAVAGALIKKFLKIQYSIYYIFDWSLRWFNNALFNSLYLWFDRYACYHSDFIWNITYKIAEARSQVLKYDENKMGVQLTVPYAMPLRKDLVPELINDIPCTVIYSGYVSYENGALLLPEIAKEIEKMERNIRFVVVGSGEQFQEMKQKFIGYNLKNVILKGHIQDQNDIDTILAESHIAIAPYKDAPFSKKRYGDVIKIRNYFACGLPVITTDVVPISKEIKEENLGLVVSYDAKKFAESCIMLLRDKARYQRIRKNVMEKAQHSSWENIFEQTLQQMFN